MDPTNLHHGMAAQEAVFPRISNVIGMQMYLRYKLQLVICGWNKESLNLCGWRAVLFGR